MKTLEVESKESPAKGISSMRSFVDTIQLLLNTLNHVLIGFVFVYTVWVCYKNGFQLIFTWHVMLCVFGVSFTWEQMFAIMGQVETRLSQIYLEL